MNDYNAENIMDKLLPYSFSCEVPNGNQTKKEKEKITILIYVLGFLEKNNKREQAVAPSSCLQFSF